MPVKQLQVIDSHTGGEPTRIVISGGPNLGGGTLSQRLERFRDSFDSIRSAVCNEPRGSDVLVGGLLCEPHDPTADFAVIFFNATGYLGMCGHGTIGLIRTLQYLKRISDKGCRVETPVGVVETSVLENGWVSVRNVVSYRYRANVRLDIDGIGTIHGDVAWGGNWFFLVHDLIEKLVPENTERLMSLSKQIRAALQQLGVTGKEGAYIDHVELFAAPHDPSNNSRNFVLCPGNAYDRSPCGTGTSAKLACLAEDGKLRPGEAWRQESIIGSVFEGRYEYADSGEVIPTISGQAFVCSESTLILNPEDPFCMGIRHA